MKFRWTRSRGRRDKWAERGGSCVGGRPVVFLVAVSTSKAHRRSQKDQCQCPRRREIECCCGHCRHQANVDFLGRARRNLGRAWKTWFMNMAFDRILLVWDWPLPAKQVDARLHSDWRVFFAKLIGRCPATHGPMLSVQYPFFVPAPGHVSSRLRPFF